MGEPSLQAQRNTDATCYIGGLDDKVDEDLLYELMLQAGPITSVHLPRDKITGNHNGFGFVEFRGEEDAEYAMKIMNMTKLYEKPIKVKKSAGESKEFSIGANIYIGNLNAEVDEKLLYDTFSAFGAIIDTPHIVRDTETGETKGYGFVSYDSFEAADLAIDCMNQQYLANQVLQVQYALKKDGHGERHGIQAERRLAVQSVSKFKPHTMFAGDAPQMQMQQGQGQGGYAEQAPPLMPSMQQPMMGDPHAAWGMQQQQQQQGMHYGVHYGAPAEYFDPAQAYIYNNMQQQQQQPQHGMPGMQYDAYGQQQYYADPNMGGGGYAAPPPMPTGGVQWEGAGDTPYTAMGNEMNAPPQDGAAPPPPPPPPLPTSQ